MAGNTVPVAVVLSGRHRGHTAVLSDKIYRVVMQPGEALLFLGADDEHAGEYHATLHRISNTYEIAVAPGHEVWVNGEQIRGSRVLKSEDLVEVAHGGPVFRYRLYPQGAVPRKTVSEAVVDSFSGAYVDGHSGWSKASRFLTNLTWELATQTTLWFRVWVVVILTILVASVVVLIVENLKLQKRVVSEEARIESITQLLERRSAATVSHQDLLALHAEVQMQLADTLKRLEQLETGPGKAAGVIAAATPSVVFLLGAYGYVEPDTGRQLRYVETDKGITRLTLEEEGQPMELTFTGTAFVVTESGLLLTNRHVVEPWREEMNKAVAQGYNLEPVIHRILAYFPGTPDALPAEIMQAGESIDMALLQLTASSKNFIPLVFESRVPLPGDEVLLLGYPTGMRALVARASAEFIESVTRNGTSDFWIVAQRLSDAGYIKPLASRGIVGQTSDELISYDAETTFGGSGGPVLNILGRVIAINTAIMPEFGGANMGIPAARARRFIDEYLSPGTADVK